MMKFFGTFFLTAACLLAAETQADDGLKAVPLPRPANNKIPANSAAPTIKKDAPEMLLAKDLFENKDCVKAFQIFQKYADMGDAEAEAWLGRCYIRGIGTNHNYRKAFEYFSRAAAKNNPWGINGLGVCFLMGVGTPINLQKANHCCPVKISA